MYLFYKAFWFLLVSFSLHGLFASERSAGVQKQTESCDRKSSRGSGNQEVRHLGKKHCTVLGKMSATLDLRLKRANKVYHEGVTLHFILFIRISLN